MTNSGTVRNKAIAERVTAQIAARLPGESPSAVPSIHLPSNCIDAILDW